MNVHLMWLFLPIIFCVCFHMEMILSILFGLTVSNIKLDDVFSDVFGKAASAITARILENPSEKIADVSGFRTKGMKATDEQLLAAVDGEMCAEQAEKLRIIRSHMDSLALCKVIL